jgi:hypothetical protein
VIPSKRLVPGVPAYAWALATVLAAALTLVGLVALVGVLFAVAARSLTSFDFATGPALVLAIGIATLPLCQVALPRVIERETEAGYTTVPFLSGDLELRDPRDGRVLLPAGAAVPSRLYRVSLRPARQLAGERAVA